MLNDYYLSSNNNAGISSGGQFNNNYTGGNNQNHGQGQVNLGNLAGDFANLNILNKMQYMMSGGGGGHGNNTGSSTNLGGLMHNMNSGIGPNQFMSGYSLQTTPSSSSTNSNSNTFTNFPKAFKDSLSSNNSTKLSYMNMNNVNVNKDIDEKDKFMCNNGKYTGRFEIQIENDDKFQVARRLIGSKVTIILTLKGLQHEKDH